MFIYFCIGLWRAAGRRGRCCTASGASCGSGARPPRLSGIKTYFRLCVGGVHFRGLWSLVLWIRMFIPDPGSDFLPSRILDPNFYQSGSRICIKNLIILTKKMVSKLKEMWYGLFTPDPDPDIYPSRILDPGVKKASDPGFSSRIRIPDPDPDFLPISDPGSRGQKGIRSQIRIPNTGGH